MQKTYTETGHHAVEPLRKSLGGVIYPDNTRPSN